MECVSPAQCRDLKGVGCNCYGSVPLGLSLSSAVLLYDMGVLMPGLY